MVETRALYVLSFCGTWKPLVAGLLRSTTLQVEPSSEMRKLLQAASKLQKKKGDSYLGASQQSAHCRVV